MTHEPNTEHVLALAVIIRKVNGDQRLGAVALAEAILAHPDSRWGPVQPADTSGYGQILSPEPGYEQIPDDGDPEKLPRDAQLVDGEWWHPVFGCDSLQMVVDNARSMLEPSPGYIDPEHQGQDLEMLQAFYRACGAEGGTADEIHLRGIKAALATQQAAQSASNSAAINVIFDAPPGPEGGRFIEVETDDGRSIRAGEWLQRQDGNGALRIASLPLPIRPSHVSFRCQLNPLPTQPEDPQP